MCITWNFRTIIKKLKIIQRNRTEPQIYSCSIKAIIIHESMQQSSLTYLFLPVYSLYRSEMSDIFIYFAITTFHTLAGWHWAAAGSALGSSGAELEGVAAGAEEPWRREMREFKWAMASSIALTDSAISKSHQLLQHRELPNKICPNTRNPRELANAKVVGNLWRWRTEWALRGKVRFRVLTWRIHSYIILFSRGSHHIHNFRH